MTDTACQQVIDIAASVLPHVGTARCRVESVLTEGWVGALISARPPGRPRGGKSATGRGAGIPHAHFPLRSFGLVGKGFGLEIFGTVDFWRGETG